MYVERTLELLMANSTINPAVDYFLKAFDLGKVNYYVKTGEVTAIKALIRTRVTTVINGEVETENTANPGDWIVTGPSGEKYVLTNDKFSTRYMHKYGNTYKACGECYAVKYKGTDFVFMAPWGEQMICKDSDYICSTVLTGDDVYRIEQVTFLNTYRRATSYKTAQ